jgi:hypothetical protein
MSGDRHPYTARAAFGMPHEVVAERFEGVGWLRMATVARP